MPSPGAASSMPAVPCGASSLLCSHALAQWGWRSWEFAVALLLGRLFPGAPRLVSSRGISTARCGAD